MTCCVSHNEAYPDDTWNIYQLVEVLSISQLGGTIDPSWNEFDLSKGKFSLLRPELEASTGPELTITSDTPEEEGLIVNLTFKSEVTIKRVCILTSTGARVLLYPSIEKDPPLDSLTPDDLGESCNLNVKKTELFIGMHPKPPSDFSNIRSLSMYIHGTNPVMSIKYIGLQGLHQHNSLHNTSNIKFELIPTPHSSNPLDGRHIQLE